MLTRREAIASGALGMLGLSATGAKVLAGEASSITVGYPADVPNWDPIGSSNILAIPMQKLVFDQPFSFSPDLTFGPSVIESYRWLDTAGKVLELKIRRGVTFHNGDPLTSDDFRFSFFDRPTEDPSVVISTLFGPRTIAKFDTPDDHTVVMNFINPFVIAPQQLGSNAAFVMPRKYWNAVGKDAFMQKPIGTGPYRLVDYQRDSRAVFEAYDKYWGAAPKIRTVTFQIIKDAAARMAAVQAGQVDFAHNLPVRDVERLGAMPNLTGALHPITSILLIHHVNKGIYQDKNLRLAMHHAIDKPALSRAFFGGKAEPLSMWAGKGMAANDPTFNFAFDPEKAKQLLAASGYGPQKPAKIDFITNNGVYPSDFDISRAIVAMWKNVGIEANLQVMDQAQYFELSRNDKLEHPVINVWNSPSGDPASLTGNILDPNKIFSVWKSQDITPRLQPLFGEVDYNKRIAGYRELDRWVVEQGYALPILMGVATVVHSKRLKYTEWRNGWPLANHWSLA